MGYRSFTFVLLLGLWTGLAWAGAKLDVRIDGVEGEVLENVKAYLQIEANKKKRNLSDQWIRRMHKHAPQEIKNALQPFGYFSATLEPDLTKGKSGWLAHYKITPGPKTRVTKVDLQVTGPGAEEPRILEALCKRSGIMNVLASKLGGHFQYFGIRVNRRAMEAVRHFVRCRWKFWLSRRSHRSAIPREKLETFLEAFPLPTPKIVHNV